MRAIFIDALLKRVTEINIEPGLQSYYRQIGCELIEAVHLDTLTGQDVMYVDEEGLLVEREFQVYFAIVGGHQPLAGNALIVGTDDEGNTVDCESSLEHIRDLVIFP